MGVKIIISLIFSVIFIMPGTSQNSYESHWVDSVFQKMSLDEKIGQLFMIRAHSDLGQDHVESVKSQIKNFHVGGLCFFQGTPQKQAELTNRYQALSNIPLMVAMDAEWGLGMRHKEEALSFPKQLTLGAINDNTLIYEMGKEIANHLRRVGVHINFAPVVDVNNNSSNPVIHNRSFGEDIYNVATKSYAYMKGLQDNSVLACAKHFPGHGDTNVDSHYDLPLINHSRERLDSLELMPFRVLSQLGVGSMMSAHLAIPALDNRANRPSSLSKSVITDLLKDQMHFDGLVFTDGLEMKGVAKHFMPGEMELEAINAGNDVLLLPIDIEKAFNRIKNAIKDQSLDQALLDQKVKHILRTKVNLGLDRIEEVQEPDKIAKDIKNPQASALISKLYEKAITLVKDDMQVLPLPTDLIGNTACLSIGAKGDNEFISYLQKLGVTDHLSCGKQINHSEQDKIFEALRAFKNIIISVHDMSIYRGKDYGITQDAFELIYKLNNQGNVTLVIFGTPYALEFFEDIKTILLAYEDNPVAHKAAADAVMGVNSIEGKLPVSVNDHFPMKSGLYKPSLFRLGYTIPEYLGISSDSLLAIDTIVQEMLDKKAAPGCQILAAKDGKIFFEKSYGNHTPDGRREVSVDDLYDLASITKIAASTLALMKLYDEGKLNIYEKIGHYLPQLDTTNKRDLIIEDMLAHHAGLPGWIPFYQRTLKDEGGPRERIDDYYQVTSSDSFDIRVCNNLFLRSDWRDSIYQLIYNCDLRDSKDYRYSDLGFYLFQQIIETLSGQKLDSFLYKQYYDPLGLKRTCFNPRDRFEKESIVPSERDDYFRDCVLHGYVHDMGAAMLGGVAGHAGLFSNAHELAVIMQMLLNGGNYGGRRFLKAQTIERFTKRYYKSSRRGMGFDMKELDSDKTLNMCEEASASTFGHLGFTGTAVFADPEHDLIYIMLSNRTYPSMENYIFAKENYRPRIQSVFYKAMVKAEL